MASFPLFLFACTALTLCSGKVVNYTVSLHVADEGTEVLCADGVVTKANETTRDVVFRRNYRVAAAMSTCLQCIEVTGVGTRMFCINTEIDGKFERPFWEYYHLRAPHVTWMVLSTVVIIVLISVLVPWAVRRRNV